jgi:hypothetical protein
MKRDFQMITIAYGFEGVDECRGNFCCGIYLWIFKVIPYFEHFICNVFG